mgnify:CR=1 FL=1
MKLNENRKREILYVPIGNLNLDYSNPRLAGEDIESTQQDVIEHIYQHEELEELAGSLALHGFLPEEPVIIVPKNSADFSSINAKNLDKYQYVVLEGNRRVSSVKLLLDSDLRRSLGIGNDFPIIQDKDVRSNLQTIPAIIYKERKNVDAYLGIRHIAGNRKWDAFAKAKYIYDKVEECTKQEDLSVPEAIEKIKHQIADRKDTIRKLYIYYKLFTIIESEIVNYQSKHIKDRFSLIQVALGMGRTTIAEYIGLKPFNSLDFSNELVDGKHLDNLKNITQWIFGLTEEDQGRVIADSRNIGKMLAPILGNPESIEYLKTYGDLAGAYELTNGEEELVRRSLKIASKSLTRAQTKIFKYKDIADVRAEIIEIESILVQIKLLLREEKSND